ncbi:sugar phosphate isomerase/epimerase family protein [Rheinheimera sp.]|uniref:sugar phosphate isomerase/epimerase family protein n=1 Tax=Rheinheimera sp. TaxID=1869214 RepID=UPI003D2860FB
MITTPNLLSLGRRQFLQQSCVGIAALTVLGNPLQALAASQSSSGSVKKTGLQLYTLRDMMEKSVADTLKLVAGVGYGDVEFAGYFGHSAADIRKLLDANGLAAPSVHVPLEVLRSALPQVIKDAKAIGHHYIVLPWLSEEQRGDSVDNYKKLAVELNGFAKPIKDAGLQLAYHNHDFELTQVKGGLPYDVLLGETDPDLVKMELDLFWAVKAGVDPLKLFAANPGRFPLVHVKDMAKDGAMVDVGTGTIDFKAIFAKAEQAGIRHQFIEHDNSNNRITTIRQGYQALSQVLKG